MKIVNYEQDSALINPGVKSYRLFLTANPRTMKDDKEKTWLMDFTKLHYFLVVASEGNITRAAEKLNMAQPPLSRQIKSLEHELGVKLIEKVGRRIQITRVGQVLSERGQQIMELVGKTENELRDLEKGVQGTLSIGSVAAWGTFFLPERLNAFHQKYPEIQFRLWEGNAHKIIELLHNGVIEIGIVPEILISEEYNSIKLAGFPVIAIMDSKWDEAIESDSISLLKLAKKPLILHHSSKQKIEKYFQQRQMQPHIVSVQDDVRSMVALAETGMGVALVSSITVDLVSNANLRKKLIVDPPLEINSVVIWHKKRYISNAARRFLDTFSPDHVEG